MIIENNKDYITAEGNVVTVYSKNLSASFYPFVSYNEDCITYDNTYTINGNIAIGILESRHDLICEIVPELLFKKISGLINEKEFIQAHIDHWATGSKQSNKNRKG